MRLNTLEPTAGQASPPERNTEVAAATVDGYKQELKDPSRILNLRENRPPVGEGASAADVAHRLQQARLRQGFRTQLDASKFLGIRNSTYASHENGNRHLRRDMAEYYAERFKVSPEWLCFGRGSPDRSPAKSDVGQSEAAPPSAEMEPAAPGPGPLRVGQAAAPGAIAYEPLSLAAASAKFGAVATGSGLAASAEGQTAAPLPTRRFSEGFVGEVTGKVAKGDLAKGECIVGIGSSLQPFDGPLALRDLWRIPSDIVESSQRLIAMKLPSNALFPHMTGGDRIFVDPDDLDLGPDDGVFLIVEGGRLVPALIRAANDMTDGFEVFRSRRRADRVGRGELTVVGRIVLTLNQFGDNDIERLSEACVSQ